MVDRSDPAELYIPGIVPDQPAALPQFLSDEFYRISGKLSDGLGKAGNLLLYGTADGFTLDPTPSPIVNYSDSAAFNGAQDGSIDPVLGTMTSPSDGVIRFTCGFGGTMSAPNQNDQVSLRLLVDGTPVLLGIHDVAYIGGNFLAMSSTFTRKVTAGMVLQLDMVATASMGTMAFDWVTFEGERVL